MPPQFTNCLALYFSLHKLPGLLAAQQAPNDSAAFAKAVSLYHDHVGDEAAIYNGRAYQPHDGNLQGGDPYFNAPLSVIGSLTFDSLDYTGIPLLFDLVRDQLIITDPKGQLLSLYGDKVQRFTIGHHRFFRLNIEGAPDFYELVGPGRVSYFVHRSCNKDRREDRIRRRTLHHFITIHDSLFLGYQRPIPPLSIPRKHASCNCWMTKKNPSASLYDPKTLSTTTTPKEPS